MFGCFLLLTAASPVLTLDILRVINNEVAVPHYREIHGQLANLHSLVQILETKDGEKEREKDREMWVKRQKRDEDLNVRFEILNFHESL